MSEIIYYPDDKRLTAAEIQAIWKGMDKREPARRRRMKADELKHSRLPELDLDDPVKLSIEYWDIWNA